MCCEKISRQVDVFCCNPHAVIVLRTKRRRDIVEIRHGADIDPRLRYCDDHIGAAEAEAFNQHHALVRVGYALSDQILAGDTEVNGAPCQLGCDLARRQIGDLDIVETRDSTSIVARTARLRQCETRAREESIGVLLQPSL